MQDWVEVPCSDSNSRFFVKPTSYFLMDPEERERKWVEDVQNNLSPAKEWIEAIRFSRRVSAEQKKLAVANVAEG